MTKRYGTLDVTMKQIANMREEKELEDRGSPSTREMVRWLADNAPKLGKRLAMVRNNEHGRDEHTWEPWLQIML